MYMYAEDFRMWCTSPKIDVRLLVRAGACPDGVDQFAMTFGRSTRVEVTPDNCIKMQEYSGQSDWSWAAHTLLQPCGHARYHRRRERIVDRVCAAQRVFRAQRDRELKALDVGPLFGKYLDAAQDAAWQRYNQEIEALHRGYLYQLAMAFAACYRAYARYEWSRDNGS